MSLRPLAAIFLTASRASRYGGRIPERRCSRKPPPRRVPGPSPLTTSPPHYWKGNLHTHTLWSDGDDFPEMVVDWYKQHGYQFLALTEHNVIAEGEKWVDAETNVLTRKSAVAKYTGRFGARNGP